MTLAYHFLQHFDEKNPDLNEGYSGGFFTLVPRHNGQFQLTGVS